MSSFLKTSFIHDETAPSESLVLHLKISFSRQHHLHFFLVFSIARPSPRIVCFALGLHQRQTGIAGNELVGHARPCPCPGALCEGWTGSPTVDLRGQLIYRYPCLSIDRAGRFVLDPNFEINFPFLSKMCDLRFSIRN